MEIVYLCTRRIKDRAPAFMGCPALPSSCEPKFALEGSKTVRQPLWAAPHFLLRASLSLHSKDQRSCASFEG